MSFKSREIIHIPDFLHSQKCNIIRFSIITEADRDDLVRGYKLGGCSSKRLQGKGSKRKPLLQVLIQPYNILLVYLVQSLVAHTGLHFHQNAISKFPADPIFNT